NVAQNRCLCRQLAPPIAQSNQAAFYRKRCSRYSTSQGTAQYQRPSARPADKKRRLCANSHLDLCPSASFEGVQYSTSVHHAIVTIFAAIISGSAVTKGTAKRRATPAITLSCISGTAESC